MDLRRRLAPDRARRAATILADMVSAEVDARHVGAHPMPGPPYEAALARVAMRIEDMRRNNNRAPRHDLSMEVVIIPAGGDVFGITYAEPAAWHDEWIATDGIEPYGCDLQAPAGAPEAQERRRRVDTWRRLMPTGVASMHGEVVMVFGHAFAASPAEVERQLPTVRERMTRLARILAFQDMMGEATDHARMADVARWLENDDGLREIERRMVDLPTLDHIDATTMRMRVRVGRTTGAERG